MPRVMLFNKPYDVLSHTDVNSPILRATLSQFVDVPGVYPAGLLDRDSEELLLLTDAESLSARIADARFKTWKTCLARVVGDTFDRTTRPRR